MYDITTQIILGFTSDEYILISFCDSISIEAILNLCD